MSKNNTPHIPYVIILCGLPGSGKTTIASLLAEQLNVVCFSTEDLLPLITVENHIPKDRDLHQNEQKIIYSITSFIASHVTKVGMSLIVTGVFRSEEQRALLLSSICDKCKVIWIELLTDNNIAESRLKQRMSLDSTSPAGPSGRKQAQREYEPLYGNVVRIDTTHHTPSVLTELLLKELVSRNIISSKGVN